MVAGSDAVYRPLNDCTEDGSFHMPTFAGADGSIDLSYFANQPIENIAIAFEKALLITRYSLDYT